MKVKSLEEEEKQGVLDILVVVARSAAMS